MAVGKKGCKSAEISEMKNRPDAIVLTESGRDTSAYVKLLTLGALQIEHFLHQVICHANHSAIRLEVMLG